MICATVSTVLAKSQCRQLPTHFIKKAMYLKAECLSNYQVSRFMTKATKLHVRAAKTQISLGTRPI